MALDRQKILNELGSVVNQLQSADCGCMGKLFNNSSGNEGAGAGMCNAQPNYSSCGGYGCGYGRCCGYTAAQQSYGGCNPGHYSGYTAPCAGEPCNTNGHCMGQCNPRRLYSDTYNYLSSNLMRPVVKEVYDDLKSINPTNTIMNSPIGAQMGLMPQATPQMKGDMGINQNQIMANQNQITASGMVMGNQMQANTQNNSAMGQYQGQNPMVYQQANEGNTGMLQNQIREGGMGNQAVGQMVNNKMGKMMAGMGPDIVNMMGSQNKARSYPHSQTANAMMGNVAPHTPGQAGIPSSEGMNQGQYNAYANMNQGQNNPAGDMSQSQYKANSGMIQQQYNASAPMNNQIGNPTAQNMGNTNMASSFNPNANNTQQGHANPGKQGYGQHNLGMSKFNAMFPGVATGELGFDPMAIAIQMNPANHQKAAMDTMQKMMTGNRLSPGLDTPESSPHMKAALAGAQAAVANIASNEQNIPPTEQTQATNQGGQPSQQPQEPVAGDVSASGDAAAKLQQNEPIATPGLILKEPIFPVDTSKFQTPPYMKRPKYYEYNTLGQPVEKLPAHLYHPSPESQRLPQTLSPQPVSQVRHDYARLHVRPTESKTSIVGNKATRKTPSRGQLQHIYNQYKGSHSYTQQNIKNPVSPASYSEGTLNRPHENQNRAPQAPLEVVGGDTAANNLSMNNVVPVKDYQQPERIGDAPAVPEPEQVPTKKGKCRNGLQDQTFPTYQGMAGWSFHGDRNVPFSTGYRYRNRIY